MKDSMLSELTKWGAQETNDSLKLYEKGRRRRNESQNALNPATLKEPPL